MQITVFRNVLFAMLLLNAPRISAQQVSAQEGVLSYVALPPANVKAGAITEATIVFKLASGYHVNSNQPSDPFLIPLKLTMKPGPFRTAEVVYPKAKKERLKFSEDDVSVYSGEFKVVVRIKTPDTAEVGANVAEAVLRYQACTEGSCLPPRNMDIRIPIQVQ